MARNWREHGKSVMIDVLFVEYEEEAWIEGRSHFGYHRAMRFLIASDIHGSLPAAERISSIFTSGSFDALLLLGDLLYHGPRNDLPAGYEPKGVIKALSALSSSIVSVRGNCEAEVDQMVLPFPVLSETALVFADGKKILMAHGHTITPEHHPEGIDCFFSGHTHIPVLEERDGILYLNPGSVSIPKGGFGPSYALWIDGKVEIRGLWDDAVMASSGT